MFHFKNLIPFHLSESCFSFSNHLGNGKRQSLGKRCLTHFLQSWYSRQQLRGLSSSLLLMSSTASVTYTITSPFYLQYIVAHLKLRTSSRPCKREKDVNIVCDLASNAPIKKTSSSWLNLRIINSASFQNEDRKTTLRQPEVFIRISEEPIFGKHVNMTTGSRQMRLHQQSLAWG